MVVQAVAPGVLQRRGSVAGRAGLCGDDDDAGRAEQLGVAPSILRCLPIWSPGGRDGQGEDHQEGADVRILAVVVGLWFLTALPSYVKHNISLAANNPSAWNYLRGILDVNNIPYANLVDFVKPYATSPDEAPASDLVDLENPPPAQGADLPSPPAIEFLADVYEKEGGTDGLRQAAEVSVVSCLQRRAGFPDITILFSAAVEISR